MKSISLKFPFFALAVIALSGMCSAIVLLNDTFADGSRLETNLPNESGFWASSPADVATSVGSVRQTMSTSSRRLHTYFTPSGSPTSLSVGDMLTATITFSPEGGMSDASTSKNFRFGLFYDPVQMAQDSVGDSGLSNGWQDATGYAVQFGLSSSATAGTIQVGKRTSTTDSLLGASGAYAWSSGGGRANNLTLNTIYTMTMMLDYKSAAEMLVTFTFADGNGIIGSETLLDNGLGGKPLYTDFDFLLFRFSSNVATANVVNIHSIKISVVPEPATLVLLGLGGLISLAKRR